jgi:hypothetical protein
MVADPEPGGLVFGVDGRGTDPAGGQGGRMFMVLKHFMVRHTPPFVVEM